MKKWIVLMLLSGFMPPLISFAIDLKQSKFTQVVNNVEIISATDQSRHEATINDIFSMPDVLRTGPDSRAELAAADGTITRVGANTIFSFDPASRTIKLDQGSLLFHSPHGKGGGTIRTGSATASVIGTTIIITCTPNGGFKLLDLEGQAEVRYLNGLKQTLEPGQMTFILPGGTQSSPVIVFRLDSETKGSTLVGGFTTPLDSQSKINSEITQQLLQILNGTAADTGYVVGNNATANSVQVIVANINNTPPPSKTTPPPIFSTDGSIVGSDHVNNLVDANDKPLLPKDYSPLDPAHTFDGSITPLTSADIAGINSIDSFSQGLSFLGLTDPASGFFGNNIDIDTANVDLSSFAAKSDFDIMAKGDLRIWQSVNFTPGFSSPSVTSLDSGQPDVISLIAGGQMLIASGSTLEADTTTFGLVAGGFGTLDTGTGLADSDYPNALEGVRLINNVGAIQILSLSDFTLEDYSSIDSGNDGAGLGLEIQSDGNLTLGNSGYLITSGPEWNVTIATGGDVDLVASGDTGIYETYVNAAGGDLKITAGGNIDIENSNLRATSPESLLAEPAAGATGSVIITGAGVDVENTYVSASGDAGIESGGTLYLGWNNGGSEIYARGAVSLSSDSRDVDIQNYDIYANGSDNHGNGISISADRQVNIEDSSEIYAYDGGVSIGGNGSVYFYNDDIEAGEDTDNLYDMEVTSYGSTVDIDDTYLYADGGVKIESDGTLTVENSSEIRAGSGDAALTSDTSDVSINDSEVYSDYGNVKITAAGNVNISDSDIYGGYYSHSGGAADITGMSVGIFAGSDVYAYDDVNITSKGASPDGDAIDIENSAIYAGYNYYSQDADYSSDGGSVNIIANNGDAYIYGDDIEAYSGANEGTGDVTIYASGTADIEGTSINANGDVSIESSGTLYLGWNSGGDDIDAGGSVSLTSDNKDVDVSGYDFYPLGDLDISSGKDVAVDNVYAEIGGNLKVNAIGNVSVSGSYFDFSNDGNVDMKAGGNIDIIDTGGSDNASLSFTAGGYVNVSDSANSDLSLNPDLSIGDWIVTAGNYVDLSADGNLTIDDSDIYAKGGDVTITAGGYIDIENSNIHEADASVSLNAGGYVNVYDSQDSSDLSIDAWYVTAGTYVDFSADDNLAIKDSFITANSGDVSLTGADSIDLENSTFSAGVSSSPVNNEGNNVTITGINGESITVGESDNNNTSINGSTFAVGGVIISDGSVITADSGDVTITGNGGSIVIGEGNNNTITINDSSFLDGGVSISGSTVTADGNVTITGDVGSISIGNGANNTVSENGDNFDSYGVSISGSTVTAGLGDGGGNVDVTSDNGNITIENGSVLHAEDGDVSLNAGGNIDIENSSLNADGTVTIIASGYVNVYDSLNSSDLTIDGWSVTAGTYVDLSADGNLTIEDSSGIYAGEGDVNITAGDVAAISGDAPVDTQGDVNIYNSSVYSDYGNVYITAASAVNISDSDIYGGYYSDSGGAANITGMSVGIVDKSEVYAYDDVNITSEGTSPDGDAIDIENSAIYAGYNYYSKDGDYTSDGGSVNITANNGEAYLYGDDIEAHSGANEGTGDVTIYASGTADIEQTTISAGGDVSIESGDTLYLGWFEDGDEIDANGTVTIKSDNGDVDFYDYEIYAYGSDLNGNGINITAVGNVDIEDSSDIYSDGGVNILATGSVYLYDDEIYAGWHTETGDMNITSSDSTVDIDDTYLDAIGEANIESSDTLTLEDRSEIDADGSGGISLKSDNADVDINDSSLYAYNASVNISAEGTVEIGDRSGIYANDNVNITSSLGSAPAPDAFSPVPGSVDIEYSDIYAGYNFYSVDEYSYASYDGGSVNINAYNGDADFYDDDIYAYSGANEGTGDVTIYASGTADIEDTYIEADGNVSISAAGKVYVSDGDFEAGYDSDTGDVAINALSGTADLENTYVSAAGSVYLESSDTLTLNSDESDGSHSGYYEVYAYGGPVDLTSDNADVDINNYSIYAKDGGDLNIRAGEGVEPLGSDSTGNVDIENSDFTVSGSAYVNASGNVYVDHSYFDMTGDGDITVNAGGNIDVLYTDGSGSGSINLTGGGYVNVYDYYMEISSLNVIAGTTASVGADQYVDIYDSIIKANGGGVNITGNSAGVDIDDTSITATGDIDVTAGGGYHEDSHYIGGHAVPSFIAPLTHGSEFVTLATFTPETFVEPAPISAPSDNINIDGISFNSASSTLDFEANLDADIYNNSSVISGDGNVMVNSGGTEEIDSSYLQASGSVYLVAAGSLSLSDSLAASDVYADIYAENGDVDIQSSGSTVDIENTYISAHGSVNIESSGTLTLGGTGNRIDADKGDVSLTSDNADVDAGNYGIYSDYGNVNISAVGNVYLSDDSIHSGYDADGGDVKIQSLTGTMDLENTYISAAGNVGILSYGTLTLGNSIGSEIDANGWANLSSMAGDVVIDRYTIYTYGSDVDGNGLTISAAVGNLKITGDSFYDYNNNGDVNMSAVGAGSTVDIDGTYIYADSDVSIESSGALTFQDSSKIESYGDNGISLTSDNADVDVNNSSLYAYNGDVDITAPGVTSIIDIEGDYISASGNVNIESSGTLTLGSVSTSTIDASGIISLKSDSADVDINSDNKIKALGSDIDGNGLTISAGGVVDIENDDNIYADYGGIKIVAADNVYLNKDDIEAGDYSDTGDMNITSSGSTVDIAGTYLYAAGDVNIESSGTLTVEDYYDSSAEYDYYSEIDSDGSSGISLTSVNGDVDVYDSSLYAYYGNVDMTATSDSANIDLQNDSISAYGNVNIESDGTLSLGNVETGGDTIYAGTGVYLSSDSGNVEVYNSTIDGGFDGIVDDLTIEDGSALTSDSDVNLNAYGATVSIHAPNGSVYIDNTTVNPGGGISISDSTITAGADSGTGGVNIYSDGYIYVGGYSDVISDDHIVGNNIVISGSDITANKGGVSIVNDAYISTLDSIGFNVENSTVVEYGDITISASQITAHNGSVDIETASSDLSDVNVDEGSSVSVNDISIYDSTITATGVGGDVTVSAGGYLTTGALDDVSISADGDISLYGNDGVNVDYTTAEAGGKVGLESSYYVEVYNSSLTADTGDAHIYADNGDVDVQGSTIKATLGNVNIGAGFTDIYNYNSEILTLNGATVYAGETANLTSSDGIHVDDSGITAASIALETHYGAANLDANDFGSSTLTANTGDADIYADNGNIDVEGSSINATHGNVNIGAGYKDASDYNSETLTLNGGSIIAGDAVTLTAQSDVDVNVGLDVPLATTLTAVSGDVDLTSYHGNVDVENSTVTAGDSVNLTASGSVNVTGGSVGANNAVNITAGTGITINGVPVTADDTVYGDITLNSTTGQTTIQNGTSMTGNLTVNSPDGILIDGSGGGTISGNTMNLTAGNGNVDGGPTIAVHGADPLHVADLSSFATVNMAAHTIDLFNVTFGGTSIVNLGSYYGVANVDNLLTPIVPGDVNLRNVTYGAIPIVLSSQVGSGIGTTPGIYVHAN